MRPSNALKEGGASVQGSRAPPVAADAADACLPTRRRCSAVAEQHALRVLLRCYVALWL